VIFKPIAIKDEVTVDSVSGTVTNIELIFTYLKDANGNIIAIPNNKFMTNSVTKTTKATVKANAAKETS
jgi:small-conductance mechanosensitive channel